MIKLKKIYVARHMLKTTRRSRAWKKSFKFPYYFHYYSIKGPSCWRLGGRLPLIGNVDEVFPIGSWFRRMFGPREGKI